MRASARYRALRIRPSNRPRTMRAARRSSSSQPHRERHHRSEPHDHGGWYRRRSRQRRSGTPVFTVLAGTAVTFEDFQIAGGDASVEQGGGILNRGTLVLDAVDVLISNATDGRASTTQSLTLNGGSLVYSNNATGNGGGIQRRNADDGPLIRLRQRRQQRWRRRLQRRHLLPVRRRRAVRQRGALGHRQRHLGAPAQPCPTAPGPEGPPRAEPDLVSTGGPSDVLLGTAILVLLAGALASWPAAVVP